VTRELVVNGRFGLARGVERGKLTAQEAEDAVDRLSFTESVEEAVHNADLVIEAIPEDLSLKVDLFRRLDTIAPDTSVFASNSSGFPIAPLAAATERPELVIGWHWASPAPVMKLAEVVITTKTSDRTREFVCSLASAAGKNPIVVRDSATEWGYVANRVYRAMVREAQTVVAEGLVSAQDLDQLMIDSFRWPVGPFALGASAAEGWGDGHQSSIRTLK
jgi:3-hydroxybutyryl-CoA dehydrogenase